MTSRASLLARALVFCAVLCVPGAAMVAGPETSKLYGVAPVAFPPVELVSGWPSDFEVFFDANLGFKRRFVQAHNLLGYWLGDLQSNSLCVGREGWLYLLQGSARASFLSAKPLSARGASAWKRSLLGAKDWLAGHHMRFLVVVAPDKHTIYEEHMPRGLVRARSVTRLDELLPRLRRAGLEVVDLRPALLAAKRDAPVFDKLDTHWNGRGAKLAVELTLQRTAELLGLPASYAALDARLEEHDSPADLSFMLSLEHVLTERSVRLVPRSPRAKKLNPAAPGRAGADRRQIFEVPDDALPKAVIFGDSYSDALIPALSESFRRSVWIRRRVLDMKEVAAERPDIVILEIAERFFVNRPPALIRPRRK